MQADAAITGHRGGALIDGRCRVVGVSTWSWTQANFSIATSAADQAEIIELMLDEDDDYGYSVDWASRFGDTGSTQQRFTLPAGLHTQSFWIDHDGDDDVDVRLHGCTDAWLWVADLFGTYSEVDDIYLTLYDDEGRFVAEDDDSGPLDFLGGSLNPEIRFPVPTSVTYDINVSYFDETSSSTTGSYLLFVQDMN